MNLDDLGPSELILWIFCIRILLSLDYLFFLGPKRFYTPDYLQSDSRKMRKLLLIILVEITHLSMIHTFFKICDFQKVSVQVKIKFKSSFNYERLHHVSNITHSILSWLIFNCGGFTKNCPRFANLEIHENSRKLRVKNDFFHIQMINL